MTKSDPVPVCIKYKRGYKIQGILILKITLQKKTKIYYLKLKILLSQVKEKIIISS